MDSVQCLFLASDTTHSIDIIAFEQKYGHFHTCLSLSFFLFLSPFLSYSCGHMFMCAVCVCVSLHISFFYFVIIPFIISSMNTYGVTIVVAVYISIRLLNHRTCSFKFFFFSLSLSRILFLSTYIYTTVFV